MTILQHDYEHMMVRQLARHWLNNEMEDYEYKLDYLSKEYEEDSDEELVIGDRDTIEQMVRRYISAQMDTR